MCTTPKYYCIQLITGFWVEHFNLSKIIQTSVETRMSCAWLTFCNISASLIKWIYNLFCFRYYTHKGIRVLVFLSIQTIRDSRHLRQNFGSSEYSLYGYRKSLTLKTPQIKILANLTQIKNSRTFPFIHAWSWSFLPVRDFLLTHACIS